MLKPISPVIAYYFDYDYIVNVLCENKDKPVLKCNGKCHLAKELKKANDGIDQKENVPPLNMKEYPVAAFLAQNILIKQPIYKNLKKKITWENSSFIDSYLVHIFQPPKFIV